MPMFFFISQANSGHVLDDNFFELLSRCQGNRMEEQRAELPNSKGKSGGRYASISLLNLRNGVMDDRIV